ncbi:hypothetical protein BY458DRAFT_517479 [Sporodiniella umbellata]|nr:hypothetical protein BY458DRAFT_517479 [Sporodiniella umbellata]
MSATNVARYDRVVEYQEFLEKHLIPNTPALFSAAFTHHWKARKEWVVPNPDTSDSSPKSLPNFDLLLSRFGEAQVPIACCHKRHFSDQERTTMSFKQFCEFWCLNGSSSGYYLKDWHFVKAFPKEEAYQVPDLFQDDWLNAYWLHTSDDDDYRFSYMGEHGTFTPMHTDVYRSYSWSSNICGIKKWTLFAPDQEENLKDDLGNLVYDIRQVDLTVFTRFQQAQGTVVYQKDGETLFVPSGWFHQVENIGATISINHNWCNTTNLHLTLASLCKDHEDVQKAIEDLKDEMSPQEFTDECQKLLMMHSGWNWATFLSILHHNTLYSIQKSKHQPDPQSQFAQVRKVMERWQQKEGKALMHYFERDSVLNQKYLELLSVLQKALE